MPVDIKTVPSHLKAGEHGAIFWTDTQLFAELDHLAVQQITDIKSDIKKLAALLKSLQKDWDALVLPAGVSAAISAAAKNLPKAILNALGVTTAQAATVGAWFIIIEAAVLLARREEMFYDDENGVEGGVFIEFMFPSPQILSQIYPRGGFKSTSAIGQAAKKTKEITDKLRAAAGHWLDLA